MTLPIIPADKAFKAIREVGPKINKDDSGRQFPMGVIVHYLSDMNDSMSVVDTDAYNFESFEAADAYIGHLASLMPSNRYQELVDDIATTNTHYVSVKEYGNAAECKYYFLMTRPAYNEDSLWEY